jgi:dipeptidyl aminopeptidase/acylaminoacyl peptidase
MLLRFPRPALQLPAAAALALALVAGSGAAVAQAPAKTLLTPETLWQFGRVGAPTVSPDRKSVLYSVTTYDLAENRGNADLWLVPATGGAPKRLTSTPKSELNPVWRPDGKKIAFLSAESGSMQAYEMNPDGSGRTQLSRSEADIDNFRYDPTGQRVLFTQRVKTGKDVHDLYPDLPKADALLYDELMYRHWTDWNDYMSSHPFVQTYGAETGLSGSAKDLMPGEPYDSPLAPDGGAEQLAFSPDGATVAYTSKKLKGKAYAESTNSEMYLYTIKTGQTQNLSEGLPGYDTEPVFAPDGSKVVWLSMAKGGFESDRNRLMVYDLKTKLRTDATPTEEVSAGSPVWSADGQKIYFLGVTRGTEQIYEVVLKTQKVRQLTQGTHNYLTLALVGPEEFICTKTTMSQPAELVRVSAKDGRETQLTFTNRAQLEKLKLGSVEERTVKTSDGKQMQVWLILPPDFDPNKKYPALLYCQGGPQSPITQSFSYRWNFQLMAANGYVVVAPNRRGLPGFGREWNDAISGDWGGQPIKDYLAAIDDAATLPYVDKTKLGAVGASYGGYSVYYLAGNHQKRFKTFIAHAGLFDFQSWYPTTEELFFAKHDLGGPYFDPAAAKTYQQFSPSLYAKNWDTPILVIHGQRDFRVPVEQGMEAFGVAQLRNIPSRFLYFPDEGHWIMRPQNAVLWNRVFFDWLARSLK